MILRFFWTCLVLISLLSSLSACGKRPKSLAAPDGGSKDMRNYPDPNLRDD